MCSPSEACFPESSVSSWALRRRSLVPCSGAWKATQGASESSADTDRKRNCSVTSEGWEQTTFLQSTSSAGATLAKEIPPLEIALDLLTAARDCGLSLPGWSRKWSQPGLSWRTLPGGSSGLTAWRQTWNDSATLAFRSRCRRLMSERHMFGPGCSSWLATPTQTANQWAPSMRKHPGCLELQRVFQDGASCRTLEWMMGLPAGWVSAETPSRQGAPRSSDTSSESSQACIRCGHPHQGPNEVCGTCDGGGHA